MTVRTRRRSGTRVWECVAGHVQTSGTYRTVGHLDVLYGYCDVCHAEMPVMGLYLLMPLLMYPETAPIR